MNWISVNDELPINGQEVLGYLSDKMWQLVMVYDNRTGVWLDTMDSLDENYPFIVSHWMPLPAPPLPVLEKGNG